MTRRSYDWAVCVAVVSHLPHDARVWKEVDSLASAGVPVRLIGMRYEIPKPMSRMRDSVSITEIPLGSRGEGRPLLRIKALTRLWWEVVRTSAVVYHCHNVHPAPAMIAVARGRRARLVYDAHELYGETGFSGGDNRRRGTLRRVFRRLAGGAARAIERLAVRTADATITTNRSRADVLERRHGVGGIHVLANVPRRVETVRPCDPGFPPDCKVLLYQGGIYARDRCFREAIFSLRELDDVALVVVGFGTPENLELLELWAEEAGVRPRVVLLPALPFDQLVSSAAGASVGLVPIRAFDLNSYLGDTNKLFEYLMAGLPVVASDLPEIRRVASQGDPQVGEVFDPGSSSSIAAAVRRVLSDRYPERCEQARRLALDEFNWEREEPKLMGIYESLGVASRRERAIT